MTDIEIIEAEISAAEVPMSDALAGALERLEGLRDEIARLRAELTAARKTNSEWLAANGPGGWINDLRDENAKMRASAARWRDYAAMQKGE